MTTGTAVVCTAAVDSGNESTAVVSSYIICYIPGIQTTAVRPYQVSYGIIYHTVYTKYEVMENRDLLYRGYRNSSQILRSI